MYLIVCLWILFIIAVIAGLYDLMKGHSFGFQNFRDIEIPYVTFDIQGNTVNMVVDTGCAVSMLNKRAIAGFELMYRDSGREVSLSAITEDRVNARGITIDFNIGKTQVSEDFFMQDVDDFGNFEKLHGVTLHGLLGSSFFDKNACKIDFKTHKLIVP